MIGITGAGNLNEPQIARSVKDTRALPTDGRARNRQDGVQFSTEGNEAAEAARFARESANASEIRLKRVEAAKQNIEQGRYRVEEVVSDLVSTLVGYL